MQEGTMVHLRPKRSLMTLAGMISRKPTTAMPAKMNPAVRGASDGDVCTRSASIPWIAGGYSACAVQSRLTGLCLPLPGYFQWWRCYTIATSSSARQITHPLGYLSLTIIMTACEVIGDLDVIAQCCAGRANRFST